MDSPMPIATGQGVGTLRRLATHRDSPVHCPSCGRAVTRKTRNQRYCSDRCRGRAKEKARNRTRKAGLGGYTGAPTGSVKFANEIKCLKPARTPPSPRISGVLDALARKAMATLKWPGWTEADYRRAYERLERDPAFNPGKRSGRKAAR